MANNSFTSSAPECPFYKEEDEKIIRCEGVATAMSTHMVFAGKNMKEAHQRNFCKDHYRWESCPLAQKIAEKY